MPPDESRNEGTPSHSEVPNAGAKPFAYFLAFEKVSRCKSGTASRNTRKNGYTPNPKSLVGPEAAKTTPNRKC